MILHFVEGGDGVRYVHVPGCRDIQFQLEAGEVTEIECEDDHDEIIELVWEDFLDDETTDEEFDSYAEMTVFRECVGRDPERYSGNDKADAFMDAAEDAGWTIEFITDDEYVVVKAQRGYMGKELWNRQIIDISWSPTRLVEAHHLSGLPGEVAKRLSSVAGALKILTEDPPKSKPVNGRQVSREEPVKRILKRIIPFDLEEAYDDEIIAGVQGRWLTWWNNESEDYERHFCMKQKNHIKIETGTAGRAVLTFISPEGFRSVALEELVQVR